MANVGVGTTAKSAYTLDVGGSINFSGTLNQNGSSFVASRWSSGNGSDIYRSSNVGIGTTQPDTNLHVEGGLKVTGAIYDKDDNAGSIGYVLSSNGSNISWIDGTSLGAQGVQGIIGVQGVQGIIGAQGNEGYVGSDGTDGAQGSQGTQGGLGAQGSQGSQGVQGINGIIGADGSQGIAGEFAGQGVQGSIGSQGAQGIIGSQGAQGIIGAQGLKGDTASLQVETQSSGSFNIVFSSVSSGVTTNVSVANSATNPLLYNANIPGVGIGTTVISSILHLGGGKSSANGAPLKVTPGSLLTVPESNAIEYNGVNLFLTQNDTTNGTKRGFIDASQFYRLSADQTPISATTTATAVSWFGANTGISLLSGYYYELEYYLFFSKTTNGTCTLQFASSSALGYTSLTATSSLYGTTVVGGNVNVGIAQTVQMTATGSIANGTSGLIQVRGLAIPADNCRLTLKSFVSAGSITPKQDSYVKVRCLGNANSIGNIA